MANIVVKCSEVGCSNVYDMLLLKGDIEILMELSSYMQTAVCTQRSEILVLELKHFERLFVKRHAKTVEMMKDNLILRLQSRATARLQQTVPLIGILIDQAIEYRHQRRLQTQVNQLTCLHDHIDVVPL